MRVKTGQVAMGRARAERFARQVREDLGRDEYALRAFLAALRLLRSRSEMSAVAGSNKNH